MTRIDRCPKMKTSSRRTSRPVAIARSIQQTRSISSVKNTVRAARIQIATIKKTFTAQRPTTSFKTLATSGKDRRKAR